MDLAALAEQVPQADGPTQASALSGVSMSIFIPLNWKRALIAAFAPFTPPPTCPTDGPRLFVALAADYGNLGDVALTRALLQFASVHLPAHRPCILPAGRILRQLRGAARVATDEDVVAIVGGGNMGDLYPDLEDARLRVVRAFPRNRIVSFPQSIDFSCTSKGLRALARSRATYEGHRRLVIFARDLESLRRMREAFPGANVELAPDTVLSMNAPSPAARDRPLMICLRQDKEAGMPPWRRSAILSALLEECPGACVTDTIVPGQRLDYFAYDRHLDTLLEEFSRTQCVVTDRLHGLIFATITETPCVVIENSNHKIRSLVDTWLPQKASIRMLTNPAPSDVLTAVQQLSRAQAPRPDLTASFAPLVAALKG